MAPPPLSLGLSALLFLLSISRSYAPSPPSPLPLPRPSTSAASSTSIPFEDPHSIVPLSPQPAVPTKQSGGPINTANGVGFADLYHCSSSDLAVRPGFFQQMTRKAKATIALLSSLIAYVSINSLVRAANPQAFIWSHEDKDEDHWISTSTSWWDRKACRWLGFCGISHFHPTRSRFGQRRLSLPIEEGDQWQSYWSSAPGNSDGWDVIERSRREIPDYVFDYAPLVHLFSNEQFWPCDIAEHLFHTRPMLNYTPVQSESKHQTLRNLHQLNQWEGGLNMFLTSNDNVEDRPPWMEGEKNIPQHNESNTEEPWADWDGRVDGVIPGDAAEERAEWYDAGPITHDNIPEDDELVREELRRRYGGNPIRAESGTGGHSDAPAVLLMMDKGNGIVDAFWFYFYSFNLGNEVFNVRFGNHVGDWEHCLVRFHHGKPRALFFSAHSGGEAYSYEAIEKIGHRVSQPRVAETN